MPFITDEVALKSRDGHHITLLEPLVYIAENGSRITVPAGFESDGGTTPREIWSVIPPFGTWWKACIVHDWLYRETLHARDFCDDIMNEAMKSSGVHDADRIAIYNGVRIGGFNAFLEDRKIFEAKQAAQRK